jgi:tripartite-type tricarboxylate transporter receptor subunit TctC
MKLWPVASVMLSMTVAGVACAQNYPAKPIRIVVSSFGSGPDIMARLIGQKLTEAWGQPVIVDARVGATGRIAAEHVAKSAADGYTLMIVTSQFAIGSALYEKLTYDPIRDFAGVALLASTPFVLVVHPSVPAKSVKELIALAKARPGQLQGGTSGAGSPAGLALQRLKSLAGVNVIDIPFKTIVQAYTDAAAGQIHFTFAVVPAVLPTVRAGRLRGLAVTSLKRTPLAPELPTIADTIPDYEVIGWYGVVAPVRTPADIVTRLNGEIVRALQSAEIREKLGALGADLAAPVSAQEFGVYLAAQIEQSRQLIKASGAVPD